MVRLFRGKVFNITSWIMVAIVSMWTIAFFFAHLLECVPIEANSGSNGLESTCVNEIPMYIGETWSDMITDGMHCLPYPSATANIAPVIILVMPIPIVRNCQSHRMPLTFPDLELANVHTSQDWPERCLPARSAVCTTRRFRTSH